MKKEVQGIYRKLYLYAFVVMATSIILTASSLEALFRLNDDRGMERHLLERTDLIKITLDQANLKDTIFIKNFMKKVDDRFNGNISYCDSNDQCLPNSKNFNSIPKDKLDEFKKTQKDLFLKGSSEGLKVLTPINNQEFNKGYLVVTFVPPQKKFKKGKPWDFFLLPPILIVLFLSLLLIPFSRYLLRPFKELIISINKVSSGDFSTKLDYNEKSDFYFLAKTFNDMTIKIQETLKSKDRLVADVSHELRSPLTKIRLSLEILGKNEKVNHKYIDKAINEIELLDKLIDDIIDSSKLDLDKNISFEKVNIESLLKESISKNTLLFEEKQIQTEFKSFSKNVLLDVNKQMIERVFDNLTSNLIKYAPEKTKADYTIEMKEDFICIKVRDRGKGVNDYEYEKIFEPFYRSDASRTRKTGGTGLGLSIVKKIIELHNGKIRAYKPEDGDGGLTIEICLPIKR